MNNMYKMIVCDLDETLLSLDRTISKDNIEAIKKCIELGIKFVPCTGRGYTTVDNTLKDLGLYDLNDQYVISFNGSCITENKNSRIISFEGIGFDYASRLYKIGLNYDVCIQVYTKDQVYIYNLTEEENIYLANRMKVIEIDDDNIDFLKNEDIIKCLYMNTNIDYLNEIENDINKEFNDIEITYSSNRYIEFNKKYVNKGYGLNNLCELLNIDLKDVIAIGDNYNDLSMIKLAGLGVGIKNMPNAIKKNCDYISINDCDHSAVAEIINKFIFNN